MQAMWAMWSEGRNGGESEEVGGPTFAARWWKVADEVAMG